MPVPVLTSPWVRGPAAGRSGAVVVSVTEFAAAHRRDLPGIARTGLRLALGWYAMPGAVGLSLWSLPHGSRVGSISVWAEDDDLRRFVGLPRHVDVMRRYRERGTVRSATWAMERFARADVLRRARAWIGGTG